MAIKSLREQLTEVCAVLPLVARDLPRANLLTASLDRCMQGLKVLLVVVPSRDLSPVKAWADRLALSVQILVEEELLPVLHAPPIIQKMLPRRLQGWRIQQLAKLAASNFVDTPFYLTLDADVLATRVFHASELVVGGRALAGRELHSKHFLWHLAAAKLLKTARSPFEYGVTPALLSTTVVSSLLSHIRSLASNTEHGWQHHLLRRIGWTEYSLYHTHLADRGDFDRFHTAVPVDKIYNHCVWHQRDWQNWSSQDCFNPKSDHMFTVMQSTANIRIEALSAILTDLEASRKLEKQVAL